MSTQKEINVLELNQEELQKHIDSLAEQADKIGEQIQNKIVKIKFSNLEALKTLRTFIDSVYWNSRNANIVVHIAEFLDEHIKLNEKTEKEVTIDFNQMNCAFVYQLLTSVQDTTIEKAKLFLDVIDEVGAEITEAMEEFKELNDEYQEKYAEIANVQNLLNEKEEQAETETDK